MSRIERRSTTKPVGMALIVFVVVFLAMLSALPRAGSATWKLVEQQTGVGKVSASWFFNDHIGIIGWDGVGWAGQLQRTTDGGQTWTNCTFPKVTSADAPKITDIYFPPEIGGDGTPHGMYSDTGYCTVAGSLQLGAAKVWVTYDSGKTWSTLPSTTGFTYPTSVRLTSHALVVAEGAGIGVHVSIDSGKSWSTSFSKFNGGLDFLDDSWGVATAVFNPLLRSWGPLLFTSNGGTQWNTAGFNFNHEEYGVYAMKHTNIFLSVAEDSVRADGTFPGSPVFISKGAAGFGTNWALATTLPFQTNGGIAGINNVVYVQNRGKFGNYAAGLYRSRDSGSTWVNVGGPNEDYDNRFSVQTCGLVIYAFDDNGGVWKTVDGGDGSIIPECVDLNTDTLRPLISTICTQDSAIYWIHNRNISEVTIQDIRLLDTLRRPSKTTAVIVDSLPDIYQLILQGDSVSFKVAWRPHMMEDSTGSDSATIRVVFYAGYLERVMVRPLDTFYFRVKLFGKSQPPIYTQSLKTITYSAVPKCTVDSFVTIINTGCDSLKITRALLIQNNWTLTDSLGNSVKVPVKLNPGDSIRLFVHATTNGPVNIHDSLSVMMHYQGKDSLIGVGMNVNANLPNPLAAPTAMQFDSTATCAENYKDFVISDTGCNATSLTINKIDLTPLSITDWTLTDTSNNAVVPPFTIKAGSNRILRLHFAPKVLGARVLSVVIHQQGSPFTNTIALTGTAVPSGTLSYPTTFDFRDCPICGSGARDTFITFSNTSCDLATVDSVLLSGGFSLVDPLSLPMNVPSSKSVTVRVRFTPTSKGPQSGMAKLIAFINAGKTKIVDSVSCTGFGTAGPSNYIATPAPVDITFPERSTCDNLDSVVYSIQNTGCDTMIVTGVNFDAAISGDFEGHSDKSFPIPVPGGQTVRLVVAMAQLAPGTHTGNYHLLFKLADGSVHDSVFAVSAKINQGQGTSTISSTTPAGLDFGNVRSCQSRDTDIVYTAKGCGSLTVNRSISGSGFTLSSTGDTTLQPGGKDVLHVHYSNSTLGTNTGVVTVKTGPPQNQTISYNVTGITVPVDTVHFLVSFSKMPVAQGEAFQVFLKPDKAIPLDAGITSIAGVLDYYADAFVFVNGSFKGMPGMNVNTGSNYILAKKNRATFEFTSATPVALDPNTPVMTATLVASLADSLGSDVIVDSMKLNGSDPTFADCVLSNTVTGLNSQFSTLCGDSTLMWFMRGKPLITQRISPNPLTSLDGYHGTIDLNAATDGIAEINLSDALGRVISQQSVSLRAGEATSYPFDLVKQSAGTYFYSIRFVSPHGTAMKNGTLMLVK